SSRAFSAACWLLKQAWANKRSCDASSANRRSFSACASQRCPSARGSGLIDDLCLAKGVPEERTVAHRLELAGRVDEHIHPDAWLERFVETAASVEESLLRVDDEDQIEIALAADVAARERSEENRAPHAELRQGRHDSLQFRFEPPPAAPARPPIHHLSDLRSALDRHDAEYTVAESGRTQRGRCCYVQGAGPRGRESPAARLLGARYGQRIRWTWMFPPSSVPDRV